MNIYTINFQDFESPTEIKPLRESKRQRRGARSSGHALEAMLLIEAKEEKHSYYRFAIDGRALAPKRHTFPSVQSVLPEAERYMDAFRIAMNDLVHRADRGGYSRG